MTLKILTVILAGLLTSQFLSAQAWYNADWPYRCAVSVPGLAVVQTDFQVKISLPSTFDFINTVDGGSDIRITAADGTTELPFWIEEWNKAGTTGTIWVKVPSLPITGLTVYLYYGNPAPVIIPQGPGFDTPPTGPFTKDPLNPIIPINVPVGRTSLLAENIVYDDVTGHYWMVLSDQTSGTAVCLVYSDDPTNPAAWYWFSGPHPNGAVIPNAIAPHIMKSGSTWYIFYGDRSVAAPNPISVATSTSVSGPYTKVAEVLPAGAPGTWEDARADEPSVLWSSSLNKWILIYMGDAGSNVEQVGYATADNILGPYTKYAGNPCIPFGPPLSYDAGTVADPWVYEYNGVYYIGYTVSPTTASPWQTALATTTDWLTFTKQGMLLERGTEYNSFRGAVTLIGNEYVFSYTGGPSAGQYRMCIATQTFHQYPPSYVNDAEAVFNFFDGFDGSGIDLNKWSIASGAGLSTVANGVLTMTATSTYVKIDGRTLFGMGYMGETRLRHPDQGTVNLIAEFGFCAGSVWADNIRIVDDFPSITNWQRQATPDVIVNMPQTADQNWHILHLYRESPGTAGFQIDNATPVLDNTNITTANLPPFLMSYGSGNDVIVDWARVRKWAGADPVATVSADEFHGTTWVGGTIGDLTNWNNALNWSTGIPTAADNVNIPAIAINDPRISSLAEVNNLLIDPSASLVISPGGDLSVNGFLLNSGSLSITSTSVDNGGSLIVADTTFGVVSFTRFLRPEINSGDRHFFSSPVGGLIIPNFIAANSNLTQIWEWDELSATWPTVTTGSFVSGKGYNLEQTIGSTGMYIFNGSVVKSASVLASSPYLSTHTARTNAYDYGLENPNPIWSGVRSWTNYGGGGWNLMGNPFTSAMDAGVFITANSSRIDPNYLALYVYDGEAEPDVYRWAGTTIPGYPQAGTIGSELQTGQGFFVLALYDGAAFEFNNTMQLHGSATVKLWKSAKADEPWPGLQLIIRCGDKERSTQIVYNDAMKAGLDPGYDVGQLSNHPDVEIYTALAEKDNSVNFARQALPVSGAGQIVVPVGIDSEKGGQVTFSAVSVPVGNYKFWLEDRTNGIFTDISTKSYSATLPAKTYGTGRFFILASTNAPTGTEDEVEDPGLRIWNSNGKVIISGEITGIASCEVYDIQGTKLLQENLTGGELNSIDLPSGLHGVFMVRVVNGPVVTTKKVVIL